MNATVFVLYLFIRSGSDAVSGPSLEIGEYPSLEACKSAADNAVMISDEEPRKWQPFVAQWACVQRPANRLGSSLRQ